MNNFEGKKFQYPQTLKLLADGSRTDKTELPTLVPPRVATRCRTVEPPARPGVVWGFVGLVDSCAAWDP